MILVIDNFDSFTYNIFQYVSQLGFETAVKRNHEISIEEIKTGDFQGIILSPGPCTPNEAGICLDVVNVFSGKIPILGICLGHQSIAAAFGAQIIRAKEIFHGRSSIIKHHQKGLFDGLEPQIEVGRYHSLIVDHKSVPKVLEIAATTDDGIIMALQHQSHLTFGIQFHPESILTPSGQKILTNFLNLTSIV